MLSIGMCDVDHEPIEKSRTYSNIRKNINGKTRNHRVYVHKSIEAIMKGWEGFKTNPFPMTNEPDRKISTIQIGWNSVYGERLDNFLEDAQITNLNISKLKEWKRDSDFYP